MSFESMYIRYYPTVSVILMMVPSAISFTVLCSTYSEPANSATVSPLKLMVMCPQIPEVFVDHITHCCDAITIVADNQRVS